MTSRSGSGNGSGRRMHRLHHREDGGVGGQAQRERGQRRGGEAAIAQERPDGVAQVSQELIGHGSSGTAVVVVETAAAGPLFHPVTSSPAMAEAGAGIRQRPWPGSAGV